MNAEAEAKLKERISRVLLLAGYDIASSPYGTRLEDQVMQSFRQYVDASDDAKEEAFARIELQLHDILHGGTQELGSTQAENGAIRRMNRS